jgi:hypothetical protein
LHSTDPELTVQLAAEQVCPEWPIVIVPDVVTGEPLRDKSGGTAIPTLLTVPEISCLGQWLMSEAVASSNC